MVGLSALWLPILLSAVIVFVVSSIIHVATPWHKGDYLQMPNEDKVMDALRPYGVRHADMPLTPAQVWRAIQGRPFRTDLAIT